LDANQIILVQSSWSKVIPNAGAAGESFYKRLFEVAPSTEELFSDEIEDQGRKLIQMITAAVINLNDLDRLVSVMKDLGNRHVGYGVQDEHHGSFVTALMGMLEQELGDAFTDDVKTAWNEAYMLLAGVMKDAAAKTAKAA